MKSIFLTLYFGLFSTISVFAQGYEYDSTETRSIGKGGLLPSRLNLNTKVSLRQFCPIPQHQEKFPTCVSWAVAYAAFTIQQRLLHPKMPTPAYSAAFLAHHLHRFDKYERGMPIGKALNQMRLSGTLADSLYTHNIKDTPNVKQIRLATQNKIQRSQNIFDHRIDNRADLKQRFKTYLRDKNQPIIVGFQMDAVFQKNERGVWQGFTSAQSQNHAVCIIGYDDAKGANGAFEIMNSWGKEWNENGFGWISYDAMARHALAAFVIEK